MKSSGSSKWPPIPRAGVNATTGQAVTPPVTQKREFWVLMG
jgi:hypothetical protein